MSDHAGFRTILVATDFSAGADAAVLRAIGIAKQQGSRVHLVHVLGDVAKSTPPTRAMDAMARRLDGIERSLADQGIDVSSSIEGPGHAWRFILQAARECHADLVIVGTRGQTPYSRILLGRTADHVIRAADVPVLCVQPSVGEAPAEVLPDRPVVLAATDSSHESELARDAVLELLACSEHATLILAHAVKPIHYYTGEAGVALSVAAAERDDEEEAARHAKEQLTGVAETLRRPGLDVEVLVEIGYPASVIEDIAKRRNVDLIALGTHGRSGLTHLLMGSIAERVLHHAECPVLTRRDPGVATPETADADETATAKGLR
ncbi:MAG: universal stress protein [Planctomycetota bacterium]|jgi:nucleotide-binding universal stress UspA family protein